MSGILHIAFNGHLQQHSFDIFEKYYPGENIMVALPPRKGDKLMFRKSENIRMLDYRNPENYLEILEWCNSKGVDRLILHALTPSNAKLAVYLKSRIRCIVYWLFWGFELYNVLGEEMGVDLVDERFNPLKIHTYYYSSRFKGIVKRIRYGVPSSYTIKNAGEVVDYFCFWNKYDYDLYVKYFGNAVKFKYFGYVCNEKEDASDEKREQDFVFPTKDRSVILNHQASLTGNHLTIMQKLRQIDPMRRYSVYMPLSYGHPKMKRFCMKTGKRLFRDKFNPITAFMPLQDYYKIIDKPEVAIFGQKRQEATGNIGHLLTVGTKIFLREDNTLLNYYREMGYYIYSFEKDLQSIDDLKGLTLEQMEHNRKVWCESKIYYDDFMPHFFE